tara:strand:+ start:245 stop:538 length:294 start_codon:yes stop_codon:yes gene_type:complete
MEQNLFDVLSEKRKVDEDTDKYSVALKNIEEGFIVKNTKEPEEDNSIEAQAKRQLEEMYSIVFERFSEEELKYVFEELLPNARAELRNTLRKEQGYT